MLMDRLFSFFIIPCVLFLLSFVWLGRVTAGPENEDKVHTRPRPPPLTQDKQVTVISTGPVVTHRHGVEPLSDTVCVPDESGQLIKCRGVEEPTQIKCQSDNERVLAIQPDALTVVNDTMVRCPQNDDTGNNSDGAELVITGVSTSDHLVMNSKSLCTANLYDLAVIAIKKEPVSSETGMSLDTAPQPQKSGKTTCSGCNKSFPSASKLISHRQRSTAATCRRGYTTICTGCGKDFLSAGKLNNHRKKSTAAGCKGGYNSICSGCKEDFLTVSKLNSHRQTSSQNACRGGHNAICSGCKEDFLTSSKLNSHHKSSTENACKGGYNTICTGCGEVFLSPRKLNNHQRTSTEAGCRGGYTTICTGCRRDFLSVNKLGSHRKASTEEACRGRNTTICPRCQTSFQTVRKLITHRQTCTVN